jgi:hypothetical protein
VNHLVLSGTATVVPSGTRSSCYRGPESELTPWRSIPSSPRNFPNLESFGFLLTDRGSRWTVHSDRAAKPLAPATRLRGQSRHQQAVETGTPTARWPRDPDVIVPVRVRICLSAISHLTNFGGRRD